LAACSGRLLPVEPKWYESSKEVNRYHTERDHTESQEELSRAAADPTDPSLFDEVETRSIDDPAEAVSWVERREQMALTWRSDREERTALPTKMI
jgi:hypothetical protein